jgi:hypothetical protein
VETPTRDPLLADLRARQRAAYLDELELLADDGPVHAVATPDLPESFLALLVRAVHLEADPGRLAGLHHYHLDMLPRRRVVVLAGRADPVQDSALVDLFATPLSLRAMPALSTAVASLGDLVARAGGKGPSVDGRTFASIYADCHYGRYAPPLGTSDPELAALVDEGLAPLEALDRRLAGPLIHELTHLAPSPLGPPYLDECVAAALGARAMPSLISPDEADHNAMVGAGWFVQVGEHLFLAFGFEAIIAAHVGTKRWDDVLPPGLPGLFAELGWQQYLMTRHPAFLGEAQDPDPWIKLIHLARVGALDRLAGVVAARGVALLEALRRLRWGDLPVVELDAEPMRASFERSFMARPSLGRCGQWRVERAEVPRRWDPEHRAWVAPRDLTGLEFRWVSGPAVL